MSATKVEGPTEKDASFLPDTSLQPPRHQSPQLVAVVVNSRAIHLAHWMWYIAPVNCKGMTKACKVTPGIPLLEVDREG